MPAPTLRAEEAECIQQELIGGFSTEEFQRKLHAGWHATADPIERLKWKQRVCLEVQGPVISQYGYEPTRKGVQACTWAFAIFHSDKEITWFNHVISWLVDPDLQARHPGGPVELPPNANYASFGKASAFGFRSSGQSAAEGGGETGASGYVVRVTDSEDACAVAGIARCQGALAGAHQALYRPACPGLEQEQWFGVLGFRDGILDALESGVLILHAEAAASGEVAGYISCGRTFDASPRPFAQVHHITVLPEHRHRGVGRRLFKELLCHLREASPSVLGDLRISVVERNLEALGWYRRLGFAEVEDWTVYPNNYAVRFLNMRLEASALAAAAAEAAAGEGGGDGGCGPE